MRTAYVLFRFPVPTETFVFQEVVDLRRMGLPLEVFTLFEGSTRNLSSAMRAASADVHRMGLRAAPRSVGALGYWWRRKPEVVRELLRALGRQRWGHLEKSGENILALLASFDLARRLEASGIEHVHAPWAGGAATAAWAASKLTGIPFTFTGRAWDIYPPDGLMEEKLRDAILVRSETAAGARHLSALTGGESDKIHVTYNGLSLRPAGQAAVAMEPPYQLLAVGRFVRKKGFPDLLRAAGILAEQGVDFRLTLAGDGTLRRSLEALAARLGIADRVGFPGFVPHDRVGELFLRSDVFVMPSVVAPSGNRDGLPTVILEALAHGVPVVATAVSGIPEILEDGVTGFLVPERDPGALADAIRRMLADRAAALAMGKRGQARVAEHFDSERNHRAVLNLYRGLPGQVRRGAAT